MNTDSKIEEKIKQLHKKRRMFCIHDNQLWLAKPGIQDSHTEWFIKENWMLAGDDSFINEHVRGYVNPAGDIYFYRGVDFSVNQKAENDFFKFLNQLREELNIPNKAKIYGGLKVLEPGTVWPAINDYGTIQDINKKNSNNTTLNI